MRALPVGDDALLVEVASGEDAQALHAELLRRRAEGSLAVREIVPAARTVLLDGLADPARWAAELTNATVPPAPPRTGEVMELPVRYDGPDLADVAAHWGVSEAEVAGIHAATEFRVAFCGFAPGFAYLNRPAAALRRAAPGDPAHRRSGRVGGSGRPVHGGLPALLTGRLAADRHHARRAVGPHARAGRVADTGHARALRPGGPGGCGMTGPLPMPHRHGGSVLAADARHPLALAARPPFARAARRSVGRPGRATQGACVREGAV
ncbi:hypothetical protein RKD18_001876 [Streptomyces phaeoluteigriseus]